MTIFMQRFKENFGAEWKKLAASFKSNVLDVIDPSMGPPPHNAMSYLTQFAAFTGAMAGAGAEFLMLAALFGDPIPMIPALVTAATATAAAGTALGGGLWLYLSRGEHAARGRLLMIFPVIAGVAVSTAVMTALPLGAKLAAGVVRSAYHAAKECLHPAPSENPADYLSPEMLWPAPKMPEGPGVKFNIAQKRPEKAQAMERKPEAAPAP